ncbi:hypothetical protein DAKH74_047240 [Maudiozyma humilis]|uniref:Uncharacterized protein n=1 Tax=Maudiozyma humilis TaxID=51915 RepID=A0AAV5S5G5_MAUHU|nr:hypothetical protein DAKH74_047240 [Kazachstania humilis]
MILGNVLLVLLAFFVQREISTWELLDVWPRDKSTLTDARNVLKCCLVLGVPPDTVIAVTTPTPGLELMLVDVPMDMMYYMKQRIFSCANVFGHGLSLSIQNGIDIYGDESLIGDLYDVVETPELLPYLSRQGKVRSEDMEKKIKARRMFKYFLTYLMEDVKPDQCH